MFHSFIIIHSIYRLYNFSLVVKLRLFVSNFICMNLFPLVYHLPLLHQTFTITGHWTSYVLVLLNFLGIYVNISKKYHSFCFNQYHSHGIFYIYFYILSKNCVECKQLLYTAVYSPITATPQRYCLQRYTVY